MADSNGAVIPASPAPVQEVIESKGLPTLFAQGVYTSMREWPSNLDLSDPREKMMAVNSLNPADIKLPAEGALRIVAHRFILVPEERIDEESGELNQYATLVLFDAKGKSFKTSSAWAWRRAKAAMELYDRKEWDMGIPFVIRLRMSERKRPFHDIRIEMVK